DVDSVENDDIVEDKVENDSVEDDSIENGSVGLNVSAYDHWSTDMKQNAWFTASCFEAVELMAIVAHWSNWYNVEVCEWLFLEPGEAKTTINSHHTA
ncbi:7624_t:CDS:2, partial [Gigaspora rosea]